MDFKLGDVIGFSGDGGISFTVNILSYGIPWISISHLGILGEHEGELLLFESTTLSNIPCRIQDKPVKGVQAVRLEDRVREYDGKVFHTLWSIPYSQVSKDGSISFCATRLEKSMI